MSFGQSLLLGLGTTLVVWALAVAGLMLWPRPEQSLAVLLRMAFGRAAETPVLSDQS